MELEDSEDSCDLGPVRLTGESEVVIPQPYFLCLAFRILRTAWLSETNLGIRNFLFRL